MEEFDLGKLENTAYALTVNLFSFLKTAKEKQWEISDGQKLMELASGISQFALNIDSNQCKYINKLETQITNSEKLADMIEAIPMGEKFLQEKSNLLIDINIILKQFKLLLG